MHFLASWRRLGGVLKQNWAVLKRLGNENQIGQRVEASRKRPGRSWEASQTPLGSVLDPPGALGHVLVRAGLPLGPRSLGSINILDLCIYTYIVGARYTPDY